MSTLRWGLLSTARINDKLLESDPAKRERWVAVGSRAQETADAYAAEKGLARAHGSYAALLADPEVDAVYIGLPNGMHAEWAQRALAAGKHVLVEKPFSADPGEVEECFDCAEERGLVLAEAFMWRHHPQAAKARELIAAGAIGELRTLHAHFSFGLDDPGDVRWDPALEGGALMDLGCYCLSGCRTLAGAEPERVHGEFVGNGVDTTFSALLRFPGGVTATFTCSFAGAGHHELVATGSTGRLVLNDPWHGRAPVIHLSDAEDVECPSALGSYALELDDFEAAVSGERPSLLGREDALMQARTIAALYASAQSHEGVAP